MSYENRDRKLADLLLLPEDIIKNVDINGDGKVDGFQFNLGGPYHTATPIDNIKDFSLTVDGERIDPEKISLIIRNNRIKLTNVPTISEIWWRLGEMISVYVEKVGGLQPGEHEIECSITMNPAFYLFMPLRKFTTKKRMIVK